VIKKPIFWILAGLAAIAASVFAWTYFTSAFPLLALDIRMDRATALERARALASTQQIGPREFRDTASFALDSELQTFVELEGGGKAAFNALVADRQYAPYRWRVRHFRERDPHEATFWFAPDGTPNGFVEKLKEDAPGAALDAAAARDLGETTATRAWGVDFTPFRPVEQSEERRTGGRVDHTFVYERTDRQLGEGRARLRLVVGGDRLTELRYFIRIPDAFTRRYENMRSANDAIGVGASLAILAIYGVGGLAIGLFFLARQRWVLWRQPIFWGAIVAVAQTGVRLNEWPLIWMQYDTALSTGSFVGQQIATALAELVLNALMFTLSFMAAESLSRRAFPQHAQFWRLWSREAAGSRDVFGQTIGGYLLVPLFVAYEVALYLYATRSLGWWTPSEALFTPDVLAAYAPWYSAIARSFQAGFWEEALFRAVPIAGAALIGDRLGNRRLWIACAFVIQSIVFGAGHAPYPTQPSYARPVELIIPSIAFGLLYLRFGLLPGIVLHFAFDVFWMGMPLFASSSSGIRAQQLMLVLGALVPIWIVLARRAPATRSRDLPAAALNSSWQPAPAVARDEAPAPVTEHEGLTPSRVRAVLIAGGVAAVLWIAAMVLVPIERHPLAGTRREAETAAREALREVRLDDRWRFLVEAETRAGLAHRFVWQTANEAAYRSLLGTYLAAPGWTVSVKLFEGEFDARAEQWTLHLDRDLAVRRIDHDLPESRGGASLETSAARNLARRALRDGFGIDLSNLKEVSAVPSKLPQRTDWTFTFVDTSRDLPSGELRLSARIAGDQVADTWRFVYVPEDWDRTARDAQTVASIVGVGATVLAALTMVGGVIAAIVSWTRRQFVVRLFLSVGALFLVVLLTRAINMFPTLMAQLSTAQPLPLQIAVLLASSVVGLAAMAAAMGLVAGVVPRWAARPRRIDSRTVTLVGIAVGAIAGAGRVAASALASPDGPVWPSYTEAASFVPLLGAAMSPVVAMLTRTIVLLLVVASATRLSAGWTRRRAPIAFAMFLLVGLVGAPGSALELLPWIGSAAIVGGLFTLAYILVLRHDLSVIPIAIAAMTMVGAAREGWASAYPAALRGSLLSMALMWIIATWWSRALQRQALRL
jgi:hypothetical protein